MVPQIVLELKKAANTAKQTLAQNLPPEECQALQAEHKKRLQGLCKVCGILRRRMLIERAYQEQETEAVRALFGGELPAAAAQIPAWQLDPRDEADDGSNMLQGASSFCCHQRCTEAGNVSPADTENRDD